MWRAEFFTEDYGRWLLSASRSRRRLYLQVTGIEPHSKTAMTRLAAVAFRDAIREQLRQRRRRAYRGPVVLGLKIRTTDRNPSHIHTITKNLLDLLGSTSDRGQGGGLLYRDDRQIHGLCVTCEHGATDPLIAISCRPLRDFCQELAIAVYGREAQSHIDDDGGAMPHILIRSNRGKAQRELLGRSGLRVFDLARLFRANDSTFPFPEEMLSEFAFDAQSALAKRPFRVNFGEPPQSIGSSRQFRSNVADALSMFRERFKDLLEPLVVPVGLEVVIKPPYAATREATHDLDNLLRRYIVPTVVEMFQPPSHFSWALDRDGAQTVDVARPARLPVMSSQPPKSTSVGLIRMEAWRIPRAQEDRSPGFVSIALVADDYGHRDSISSVDRIVDSWVDGLR